MKKKLTLVIILTLALISIFSTMLITNNSIAVVSSFEGASYTISVSGEGVVSRFADTVTVFARIETHHADQAECLNLALSKYTSVKDQLIDDGIDESHIKRNYFYTYNCTNEKEKKQICFCTNLELSIKFDNADTLENYAKYLQNFGINSISYVNYSASQSDELYNQALTMAIESAYSKVQNITKSTTIQIIEITEESNCYYPVLYREANTLASAHPTDDQPTIDTTARVRVKFAVN